MKFPVDIHDSFDCIFYINNLYYVDANSLSRKMEELTPSV